jgi:hypothetical protein
MEEALVALLLADAGVAALVGTSVFWGVRPQGTTLPAITLTRISGQRDYTNEGASGLVSSRVQIDCEAETYLSSKTVARAVIAALAAVPTSTLQGAFVEGERDLYEFDAKTDSAVHPFATSLDVILHHSE